MNKSILSLVLAFVMVFSAFVAVIPAMAEGETAELPPSLEYMNAIGVLKAVRSDFPLSDKESTTRAEFTASVAKMLNCVSTVQENAVYADVPADHEFASEISFAKTLGLISDAENFNPDNPITYTQAIKILICAMGYGEKAELTGGYPTAYLKFANDLDLIEGIYSAGDDVLSHEDSIILIFNAVCTDIAEQTSFGSNIEYTSTEGKNILSVYHKIYIAEGVVDANEFSALENASDTASESCIEISKVSFYGEGYDGLLGRNARIFYRDDNKSTIVYAYAFENTEYTYTSDDSISLSGLTLTVFPENELKEKRYKLNGEYSVIYNGKYLSSSNYAEDLENVESGTITLVDNNESAIDVIIIRDVQYGVIGNVNIVDGIIYDAYKERGMTDLGKADGYTITEADGTPITIRDLKAKDTIGIAKSKDGKKIEVIRYKALVSGTLDATSSEGEVFIADSAYKLSKYYTDNFKLLEELSIGVDVVAYLGEGNVIINIAETDSIVNYGYIVEVGTDGLGLSEKNVVRLFGENGKMNILPLAKSVKVNGSSVTQADALTTITAKAELMQAEADLTSKVNYNYLWRVVKYSVNSNGELSSIWTTADDKVTKKLGTTYTVSELQSQIDKVYGESLKDDSQPLLFDDNTSHSADGSTLKGKVSFSNGMFYPFFRAADDAVVLRVPSVIRATDPENQSDDWKEERAYSVSSVSGIQTWVSANTSNISCFGYDVDKEGAHLILWVDNSGSAATVGQEGSSAVVENVSVGLNPDGEKVAILQLYYKSNWERYYCLPKSDFTDAAAETREALYGSDNSKRVKPGDIVNIALNSNNEITAIERDFSYIDGKRILIQPNASETDYNVDDNGITRYASYTRAYNSGYIYSISGKNAMAILGKSEAEVRNGEFGVVNMKPVSFARGTTVYVDFDRDRNKAVVSTEADTSTIESYYTAGMNADYVVVRGRFNEVYLNVVYRN